MKSQILVVGAIIWNKSRDQFLIVQRDDSGEINQDGLWEFPGGKVELGESPESALKREIFEEMKIDINVGKVFGVTSEVVERDSDRLHLIMITYDCQIKNNQNIKLEVGRNYKWISTKDIKDFKWAILDIPLLDYLK
jgi:8-oxo-dGTP diphosphatase